MSEDIIHVLRNYRKAKDFWNSTNYPQTLCTSFSSDLESWIEANARSSLKVENKDYPWSTIFLFGIWNLWLQCNQRASKQQAANPFLLRAVEIQVKKYFYCVSGSGEDKSKVSKEVRWTKPVARWPKLNTDESMMGASGLAGCGGLVRDSNRQWIIGFAKPISATSRIAKMLFTLREGLALCVELKVHAIAVELDASAAISLVSSNITSNGDLSSLVDDCREFLLRLPQARMSHYYREAN